MQKYLIGVDLGTSGMKTVLFTQAGQVVCTAVREYPLYQPMNGWAEQNPQDWWQAAVETLSQVVKQSGVDTSEIVSIGMSGQMHGMVMLDEQGDVLRNSIIWADQRTGEQCKDITRLVGRERLIEITANPAMTGFTASKILWVQQHQPEIYKKCRYILLPKDYLRYKLTGDIATEVSDASGMQLLDVPKRSWSEEVCKALHVDIDKLGKVYESPEVTGHISEQAARLTGLSTGTLVVGGAGDNAAAAVGTGVVQQGKAFATIGTSGVVFAHTDGLSIDPKGRVHSFCCAVPGAWHVMGVMQAAGLSLKWLRDIACTAEKETAHALGMNVYDLMSQEAAQSPIGANKLLYLPYLMGERTPHVDPDCRGVFFGLSAMHQRKDLIRAVMEGVAFAMNDSVHILKGMDVDLSQMVAVGGGGKSPFWRQILADVFACDVCTTANTEGAALGAAILAGVGAGVYESVPKACEQLIGIENVQPYEEKNRAAYEPYYEMYTSLYPALQKQFSKLQRI